MIVFFLSEDTRNLENTLMWKNILRDGVRGLALRWSTLDPFL